MTRRTPRQAAAWHMVIGVLVILGTFVALSLVIR
jgi:nitrogen fixation protein FixH